MNKRWKILIAVGVFIGLATPKSVSAITESMACNAVNEYEVNLLAVHIVHEDGVDKLKLKVEFVNDPAVCGISFNNERRECYSPSCRARGTYWYHFTIDGSSKIDYIASVLLRDPRPQQIVILLNFDGNLIGIKI